MKARAIRPLCWPLLTNSFQLEKVCGYKGEEITLTTFLTTFITEIQLAQSERNTPEEYEKYSYTLLTLLIPRKTFRNSSYLSIFQWEADEWSFCLQKFTFSLFQSVENMILCKCGKYWKEIDALERNWGNRWCSDIDGTFMHWILNQSPPLHPHWSPCPFM